VPALAQDVDVVPGSALPGQAVKVQTSACNDTDARAQILGAALNTTSGRVRGGLATIPAVVRKVPPGSYRVVIKCLPSGLGDFGYLTVRAVATPTPTPKPRPRYPAGGAMTGGGGTQDGGGPWTWLGLALLAGAAATGGIATQRSRAARGRA
jgi:hypothetical protein